MCVKCGGKGGGCSSTKPEALLPLGADFVITAQIFSPGTSLANYQCAVLGLLCPSASVLGAEAFVHMVKRTQALGLDQICSFAISAVFGKLGKLVPSWNLCFLIVKTKLRAAGVTWSSLT